MMSGRRGRLLVLALGWSGGLLLSAAAPEPAPPPPEPWERAFPTIAAMVTALQGSETASSGAPVAAAEEGESAELGRLLSELMGELYGGPEDRRTSTTTPRGEGTPCTIDRRAFRQPFLDTVLTEGAFVAWEGEPGTVWLEQANGAGERVPLTLTADPAWGQRAPIPALAPGDYVIVRQPERGEALCLRVKVSEAPGRAQDCPSGGEQGDLCRLLTSAAELRYSLLPGLVQGLPDEDERVRAAGLVACAFGYSPNDVAPGTRLRCRQLHR